MATITIDTLPSGSTSKTVTITSGDVSSILVTDKGNNQKITPDIQVSGSNVTVTVNEAYANDLKIIVTSI